jgi:hypothetical protein
MSKSSLHRCAGHFVTMAPKAFSRKCRFVERFQRFNTFAEIAACCRRLTPKYLRRLEPQACCARPSGGPHYDLTETGLCCCASITHTLDMDQTPAGNALLYANRQRFVMLISSHLVGCSTGKSAGSLRALRWQQLRVKMRQSPIVSLLIPSPSITDDRFRV